MGLFVGSTDICVPGGLNIGASEADSAYVGETQIYPCGATGQCFTWGDSEVCLPWAGIMPDGVASDWVFEIEFKVPVDYDPAGPDDWIPLFENRDACGGSRLETNKRFSTVVRKSGGVYTSSPYNLVNTVGTSVPASPGAGEVEAGDWCKLTITLDTVVSNQVFFNWENLTDANDSKIAGSTFIDFTSYVAAANLVLGAATQWTTKRFDGEMRNIRLTVDGVVEAEWPIQGYITEAGVVLDISGNENHGTVHVLGTGSIGDCP